MVTNSYFDMKQFRSQSGLRIESPEMKDEETSFIENDRANFFQNSVL